MAFVVKFASIATCSFAAASFTGDASIPALRGRRPLQEFVGSEANTAVNASTTNVSAVPQSAKVGEHPFVTAVLRGCKDEPSIQDLGRSPTFYQIMERLEDSRVSLSEACKAVAFAGTISNPNPMIFTVGASGKLVTNASEVLGYIEAPLFYNTPGRSPIYNTWFGYVPAETQPAPKGLLFVHCGGPLPSIRCGFFADQFFFPADAADIRANYDIVSMDMRGMGMSGLGLLKDIQVPTEEKKLLQLLNALAWFRGSLTFERRGTFLSFPCAPLARNSTWFEPENFGDLDEVKRFLKEKIKNTAACSKEFDMPDGHGGTYNLLQYMGTQALVHDLEWFRWSVGAPPISFLGFSYGTRVTAAYVAQFPNHVHRVVVSGVMGPIPDVLSYAKEAAVNSAQVLGFIQSQCAADEKCTKNPFREGECNEEGFYFEGDINEAIDVLFQRSRPNGAWYESICGMALSTTKMTTVLQAYFTSFGSPERLGGFQDAAWPWGFAALPSLVFHIVQNPCQYANAIGTKTSGWDTMDVFHLVPALDMAGRWSLNQVATFISSFARDDTFAPALNMFLLYAYAAYGWPQLPTPIGFSNPDVEVVIANPLYDERTGLSFAHAFQLNFPKSSLITSMNGGHCVGTTHGKEAWALASRFLIFGTKPRETVSAGRFVKINWTEGVNRFKSALSW